MSDLLLHHRRGRVRRVAGAPPTPPEPPAGTRLAGASTPSSSRLAFPKTGAVTAGDYYVATTGSDSNDGGILSPFRTITKALSVANAGETILVRGGVYPAFYTSRKWASNVKLFGYGTERPKLDGNGVSTTVYLEGVEHLHIKHFEVINGSDYGVRLSRCNDSKLEDIWVHHCATNIYGVGVFLYECNRILTQDSAVWHLGTPGTGGSTNAPDGFTATAKAGTGNTSTYCDFVRVFAANCVDDATDFYRGSHCRVIESAALASGYFYSGDTLGTEGNGFKLGSSEANSAHNELRGSVAVHANNNAVNANGVKNAIYRRNTAASSRIGFAWRFTEATAEAYENISLCNRDGDTQQALPYTQAYNSWMPPIMTCQAAGFADPDNGDFSLMPGSAGIGAGEDGGNIGASGEALDLLMRWWNHNEIWIPGRGLGSNSAPLPDLRDT